MMRRGLLPRLQRRSCGNTWPERRQPSAQRGTRVARRALSRECRETSGRSGTVVSDSQLECVPREEPLAVAGVPLISHNCWVIEPADPTVSLGVEPGSLLGAGRRRR